MSTRGPGPVLGMLIWSPKEEADLANAVVVCCIFSQAMPQGQRRQHKGSVVNKHEFSNVLVLALKLAI